MCQGRSWYIHISISMLYHAFQRCKDRRRAYNWESVIVQLSLLFWHAAPDRLHCMFLLIPPLSFISACLWFGVRGSFTISQMFQGESVWTKAMANFPPSSFFTPYAASRTQTFICCFIRKDLGYHHVRDVCVFKQINRLHHCLSVTGGVRLILISQLVWDFI